MGYISDEEEGKENWNAGTKPVHRGTSGILLRVDETKGLVDS